MMQNNRIQYLDLIRGGLILYVVFLSHVYAVWTYIL